ncbi:MAG: hypothetical protein ACETVR_04025 [Candidatus Bathyarchaeia archaeon]
MKTEAEIRSYLEILRKEEAKLDQIIRTAKDEETKKRWFQPLMYIQRQIEILEWVLDEYP